MYRMSKLKEKYRAFTEWQKRPPFRYEIDTERVNHCVNCDHDFTGNFCPYCSQRAGTGRLTWQSVRSGVLDVWAMGARSMPMSIWQLLTRPGYFIADYITGKRMVSFPPVKMLFAVGIVLGLIEYWFFPEKPVNVTNETVEFQKLQELIITVKEWLGNNKGWSMLFFGIMLIFPTWVLFRFSPRVPKHTLAEGFFIQVFIGIQSLVVTFFSDFWSGFALLGMFYVFYTYKQLFGYGIWGTLWRLGFMGIFTILVLAFVVVVLVPYISPDFFGAAEKDDLDNGTMTIILLVVLLCIVLLVGMVLFVGYLIGRRDWRMRQLKAEHAAAQAAVEE